MFVIVHKESTLAYSISVSLILKTAGKVAGAFGTIALATAGVPEAANAAKAAKATKEVVQTSLDIKKIGGIAAGAFGVGLIATKLTGEKENETTKKIDRVFSGAMKSKDLVNSVASSLKKHGFTTSNTLVATSFCVDELSRVNEKDFAEVFGPTFNMGGLAGFPMAGVTGFGAMASHIPDGGNCVVVFAPHVGVDSKGNVGTVERVGRANGGACCGSAVAASGYVAGVLSGSVEKSGPPTEPLDAGQAFVGSMLLPQAARLDKAPEKMAELPYAIYDAQKEFVDKIVKAGCGNVKDGKIAVLGGVQINTPPGLSDYFLPLSFEVLDNKGNKIEDMLPAL